METSLHKLAKDFWLSLGRALDFEVNPEEKLSGGIVDVSWKKNNLFIGIEVECGPSGGSLFNLDKFKDSNPKLIIVECFYASTAQKVLEEKKKYHYKILVLNHNLKDNQKYMQHLNNLQNDFINKKDLKGEFNKWFQEINTP